MVTPITARTAASARADLTKTGGGGGGGPAGVAGCIAWWDPSNTGSVTSSAGKVSALADLSGSGFHLTQGTAGKQPGLATMGGLQCLNFDGNDDVLTRATLPIATPCTVFVVANSAGGGQSDYHRFIEAPSGLIDYSLSTVHQYGAPTTVNSGLTVGSTATASVYSIVFNGASSGMWRNGTAGTTGNTGTSTSTGLFLGGDNTTYGWLGGIGETLIYNLALTTGNRQTIENYLRPKWGAP